MSDATCQSCGTDNPVWSAPNDLWNKVMGGPDAKDDPGGVLCPNCFIKRAERYGVIPGRWTIRADYTRYGGGLDE